MSGTVLRVSAVPPDVPWDALSGRIVGTRTTRPDGDKARVRDTAAPWVRLPFEVTKLAGDGPWTLEVVDADGLWRARAEVTRKAGIEHIPVALEFRSFGALEFLVVAREGGLIPVGMIELTPAADGVSQRIFLEQLRTGNVSSGHARFLAAGEYHWTMGLEDGDVVVEEGEVAVVAIMPQDSTQTFGAEIIIDAGAVPDMDMSLLSFTITSTDDLLYAFQQSPVHVEGDAPARWRLRLDGLPLSRWNVVPNDMFESARWDPKCITIAMGEAPPHFVMSPPGEKAVVRIRVIDAETGRPLSSAESMLSPGGLSYIQSRANEDGQLRSNPVPAERECHAFVRAPGYRTVELRFVVATDGSVFEVALERGWRSVVRVVRTENLGLIEGIEILVDGTPRGRTNVDGLLWIDGDGPPTSIGLGKGAERLEATITPLRLLGPGLEAPLVGYTFVVRTR